MKITVPIEIEVEARNGTHAGAVGPGDGIRVEAEDSHGNVALPAATTGSFSAQR